MVGKNTKMVGGVLLVAIILVVVAYAAITNVGLNINGVGSAQAKKENFKVEFIGTPSTSGKGTTTATINSDDKTQGSVIVTGLTAKGDEAVATYTVKNQGSDISADLTAEATSSNEEYFEVKCSLEKTTLKAQEETTLKATVRLLKTPIDETKENLSSNIEISITAEPKQPGEETNGDSETVSSNKTTIPYLPTSFTQVSGTTLKNGLTIQDSTENQYVWIEVPKTEEVYQTAGLGITNFTEEQYVRIEKDLHTYTNEYRNGTSYKDEYYSNAATGLTSAQYEELKKTMLKSVYQKGGFYVGKYETGIESTPKITGSPTVAPTEIPVIKPNAYPYNYVTCSQAQTLASNMESGNHTSSLMFGVQWDLVLKYLETKGTSQADLKNNSTSWGNYRDNAWNITNEKAKYYNGDWISGAYGTKDSNTNRLLSTGSSDTFSKQEIYDLAGNVYEWTLEYTSDSNNPCAYRGGCFSGNGNSATANFRKGDGTSNYQIQNRFSCRTILKCGMYGFVEQH